MALKENIEAIKKEIGIQEKFLEGIIKSEYFFKKYKKYVISFGVAVIITVITITTLNILKENKLESSNEAYSKLLKDPNDSVSRTILKESNERLYNFFRFQQALKSDDIAVLKELAEFKKDPVISDLAAYQAASLQGKSNSKSELLVGFDILKEGYKLLREGKIEAAKLKFAQIDLNSPLKNISNNLEHYQGIQSKGSN